MTSLGGIIDVAIGMSFMYLLLSLICSGMNELTAWALGRRSSTLREGIRTLLEDDALKDLGSKIYAHPLIQSLSHQGKVGKLLQRGPSYIPSSSFALALLDTLRGSGTQPIDTLAGVKELLASLPGTSPVRRQLALLVDEGVKDVEAYRQRVATWFDQRMDRLSGAYKRRTQLIGAVFGLLLAFGLGVDSWVVGNALMRDGALRQAAVAAAVEAAKKAPPAASQDAPDEKAATQRMVQAIDDLDQLELPIGWTYLRAKAPAAEQAKASYWLHRALGMLFTGLALALGAPFWFDLLSKLLNLRSAGPQPQKPDAPRKD